MSLYAVVDGRTANYVWTRWRESLEDHISEVEEATCLCGPLIDRSRL